MTRHVGTSILGNCHDEYYVENRITRAYYFKFYFWKIICFIVTEWVDDVVYQFKGNDHTDLQRSRMNRYKINKPFFYNNIFF